MKKIIVFLMLFDILLVGCAAAQESPTATSTLPPTIVPTQMPTNTPVPRITHIYAFGDGYTDNGNTIQIARKAVEIKEMEASALEGLSPSWEGRNSNGPVAVEILAGRLNVGLTDFAVDGAMSSYRNEMDRISLYQNTGILGQIDKFIAGQDGKKADPASLFFIEIGGYDLAVHNSEGGALDDQSINDLAERTVANIVTGITTLTGAGAKQFMVESALDLTIPLLIGSDLSAPLKVYQKKMDSKLPVAMADLAQRLNIKISLFDFTAINEQIRSHPGQYGFTNLTDPCVPFQTREICAKPDEYYYWDLIYPTRRVHQILGEAMADQLSK